MPKNSQARIDANNRYALKTYEHIQVRVKKGERERLQIVLKARNMSLNSFYNSCASYCIENDIDVSKAKPLGDVLPDSDKEG